jgi:hypothetical protein
MAHALWLSYVEGQTLREIGDELGVTRGRVGQMVQRGLFKLRRSIGADRYAGRLPPRVLGVCPPPLLDAVFGGDHWRERYGVTAGE